MELISETVKWIVKELAQFGYWGIGVGMALESGCIPLPSEIVLPFAGYLVSQGHITMGEARLYRNRYEPD